MSFSDSVRSNYFLRQWVAPAEMISETNPAPSPVPAEGWRRGAMRGADIGGIAGSVVTLPVDLVAGTLHGSARRETEAAYERVSREALLPLPPMPLKQRFLLRLENGLLGAVNVPLRRVGSWLGSGAGAVLGVAVGTAEGSLKALGGAALWAYRAWHATARRPAQPVAFAGVGTILGRRAATGARMGGATGEFSVAFCVSLTALGASLASAGVKGTCVAAGVIVGGLVGLGVDARDVWRHAGAPASEGEATPVPVAAPVAEAVAAREPVPVVAPTPLPFAKRVAPLDVPSVLRVAPFSESTSELASQAVPEAPSLRVLTPEPIAE